MHSNKPQRYRSACNKKWPFCVSYSSLYLMPGVPRDIAKKLFPTPLFKSVVTVVASSPQSEGHPSGGQSGCVLRIPGFQSVTLSLTVRLARLTDLCWQSWMCAKAVSSRVVRWQRYPSGGSCAVLTAVLICIGPERSFLFLSHPALTKCWPNGGRLANL